MGIFSFISGLITPISSLIQKVVTRDEDRLKIESAIVKMENELAEKFLEYESKLLDAKSQIIIADAQGNSWIQRTWRPISMLTFLVLIVLDVFGVISLPEKAWTLFTIGMGGHVVGRSAEKIAPNFRKTKNQS